MTSAQRRSHQAQTATVVCRRCKAEQPPDQRYCINCGEFLSGPIKKTGTTSTATAPSSLSPSTGSRPLGSLVDDQHRKHIKGARIAIMFVAAITIIVAVVLWVLLEMQIGKVNADPMLELDREVVSQAQLDIGVTFVMGVVFFILFIWAKSNPFAASLTALILYIANHLILAGMDPRNLTRGLIVKVIIIFALARGVKSGLAFQKNKKRVVQHV